MTRDEEILKILRGALAYAALPGPDESDELAADLLAKLRPFLEDDGRDHHPRCRCPVCS